MSNEKAAVVNMDFAAISKAERVKRDQVAQMMGKLKEMNRRLTELERTEANLEMAIEAASKRTTRQDEVHEKRAELARTQAAADQLGNEIDQQEAELAKLRADGEGTKAQAELSEAVAQVEQMKDGEAELEAQLLATTEEAKRLELTADLNSDADLARLAALYARCNALPKRIASCQEQQSGVDEVLHDWVKRFVSTDLGPRARKVANLAYTRARNALREELDGEELNAAVERSSTVREANALLPTIEDRPQDGALGYAKRMLQLSRQIDLVAKRRAKATTED